MFGSVSRAFNIIAVFIILLFGAGYLNLVFFHNAQSESAERIQEAITITGEVKSLQEWFYEIRYWERSVLLRDHPDADKKFGRLVERFLNKLSELEKETGDLNDRKILRQISDLLTAYENDFSRIVQLKTEQRLKKTLIESNYSSIASIVLWSNEPSLLKPLFNLTRFQNNYLSNQRESEYQALKIVINSIDGKFKAVGLMDDRLADYIKRYRNLLDEYNGVEAEASKINENFNLISSNLANAFANITEMAEHYLNQEMLKAENKREQLRVSFLVSSVAGILILLIVMNVISRRIIQPIMTMGRVIKKIEDGDLNARFESQGQIKDEIVQIGWAFNAMMDTIIEKNTQLTAYQHELEKKINELAANEKELKKHRTQLSVMVDEKTEELQRAIQSLTKEIYQRKQVEKELVEAKEAAESASIAKSEFLANMSHEIRTPLNGVISMVNLLVETKMTFEQREFLEILRNSADSLLFSINDILDYSKIEAGKLELEPVQFNLAEMILEIIELHYSSSVDKKLGFYYRYDPAALRWYVGDPVRIRQILMNLISNSVKFTSDGYVFVDIHAVSMNVGGAILKFEVTDTGIGIPEDKLPVIFEQFSQADASTTRKYGGTGLGLAIVKQLVDVMGGEIEVKSSVGQGTTFTVFLPLENGPEIETTAINAPKVEILNGLKILVVQDDSFEARILDEYFKAWKMDVKFTTSNGDILQTVSGRSGNDFSIILFDSINHGEDALTQAAAVAAELGVGKPLIALIGEPVFRRGISSLKQYGVSGYLPRPVDPLNLAKLLIHMAESLEKAESPEDVVSFRSKQYRQMIQVDDELVKKLDSLNVLLVEDSSIGRKAASWTLEKIGCHADTASNGKDALLMHSENRYDIIFMDVQMPEIDGLAATRKIREMEKDGEHAVIIAMTANAMKDDKNLCLEAGMDDYVSKPFNKYELMEFLEKWTNAVIDGNVERVGDIEGASVENALRINPAGDHESKEQLDRNDSITWGRNELDPDELINEYEGDVDFLEDMINVVSHAIPVRIGELKNALSEGDFKRFRETAHRFKGELGNFTRGSAYQLCMNLELKGKNEDFTDVKEKIDILEEEAFLLNSELKKCVEKIKRISYEIPSSVQ